MNRRRNAQNTYRVTLCGLLVAVMLVLGYIESMLPDMAVPGIKLGLSNGVLIFAVYMLDIPTAYILMTLKVVLSGLMFGGVTAMMYAFAGGLLSLTAMCLLSRVKGMHPVAVSMVGGVMHNVGQVAMAMIILHTAKQMLYYLGILTLVGLACGALTGIAATGVMKHLKAAKWKAPGVAKSRASVPLMIAAVIVVTAGLIFAWQSMNRSAPVEVVTVPNESGVQMLTVDDLNLNP